MHVLTLIVLAAWLLAFVRTIVNLALIPRLRADAQPDDSFLLLGLLFRRALIGAALVMFVCIAWSYHGLISQPDNEIALVNYEVREDLLP